jgi:hypothetical protein
MAPALTLDDTFNSHPLLGTLAYRLPSVADLFGMPKENFDSYWEMSFQVKVIANGEVMGSCGSRCTIKFTKNYTPVIYHLNPRVVY